MYSNNHPKGFGLLKLFLYCDSKKIKIFIFSNILIDDTLDVIVPSHFVNSILMSMSETIKIIGTMSLSLASC